jgi:molybdopterin molybdotransferase
MIGFEKAYEIVMDSCRETGSSYIPFPDSLNRTLSEDISSDIDMPPFDKSSVDGFACRKEDLERALEIIETIPAGFQPVREIGPGQCSRIMTGAVVPAGANCVVMVEDTEILPSGKIRSMVTFSKSNIAFRAEDVSKGDILLKAGKLITPQDIAVMAMAGRTKVKVAVMPLVAVISSGSELVEPSEVPGISQIRNSNAWQLLAQIQRAGARGNYYGIAKDDPDETLSIVSTAISENNIVIISGGVSMGDFDFVPSVLEKAGVKILFTRVAVQPGKPTNFGVNGDVAVFGLPGNPVSSFVQFELLIRPLICKMMRNDWHPSFRLLPMKEAFTRKSTDRMALIPVTVSDEGYVTPVEYHGSAHITSLCYSDGIISLAAGAKRIEKGEIVSVRQI